ncbi:MAG: DUF935 domain-containing protein, partial [Pseudomonadota bacterium]
GCGDERYVVMDEGRLLDAYGRPLRKRELLRMHAEPGLTSVRQAWAHTIASGLTPQGLASVLLRCNEGDPYDYMILAEEMEERDAHYGSVLGTRKRAISGIAPIVTPGGEDARDDEIADAVREDIAETDGFADLVEDLMDGIGKGYAAVEIGWKTEAKRWTPEDLIWRDPRFFRFDRETGRELRLLDEEDLTNGVELPPYKFLVHKPKIKSGLALRGGIARLVAFGWMCKAYTVKDWMAFVETYGMPIRVGKYGPQHTESDVNVLMRAVASIGTDAAAVLPMGMEIDFEGLNSGPGNDVFEKLARYCDEQTSKAVVGQTMTTDDGSSQSQATVHNEVRHDIMRADARQVSATINRDLVKPFVDLNFGPQENYPRISIAVTEPEDLDQIMGNVERAANLGVTFHAPDIRAKLGFDAPPDDADPADIIGGVPQAAQAAPPPPPPPAPEPDADADPDRDGLNTLLVQLLAGQRLALNKVNGTDIYAGIDAIEAQALLESGDQMADLLGPVEKLLAEVGTLEEFHRRLPELLGEMELSDIVGGLTAALWMARAEGDFE